MASDQGEDRVAPLAEQIVAGVLPQLGRIWGWRMALAAVAGLVVLAGAVAGLLALR